MPRTYYSMEVQSARESWRSIRTLRSDLPSNIAAVLASDSGRLETFHSALEQSQQQFAAAAAIGYESRPLNLFYGLSQAGRAVAAASELLDGSVDRPWRSTGHGVRFGVPLADGLMSAVTRVEPSRRDSLSRVSAALGVATAGYQVSIGDVLTQIPDYWMEFQDPAPTRPPLGDIHLYDGSSFPSVHGIRVPGAKCGDSLSLDDIKKAVAMYPALARLRLVLDDNGGPVWIGDERLSFEIEQDDIVRTGTAVRIAGTTVYRSHDFLLPALPDGGVMMPLPAWWLFLHALSMLARYAPDDWTRITSIRTSPIASRIEFMLDVALDAVPELLLEALTSLDTSRA